MANPEHFAILKKAVINKDSNLWNAWLIAQRGNHVNFRPNLIESDLRGNLLPHISFINSDLMRSDLRGAQLNYSRFINSDLRDARLNAADIRASYISNCEMNGANLSEITVGGTTFAGLDLSQTMGLDTARHLHPSTVGIDTLVLSRGQIPEIFLRGCGVPDTMIAFSKSLVGKAIEYYSCFISYSSTDEIFARRLHNDLQANGVRVWFAPEDIKTGEFIQDSIDQAVRLYDKLILVLSKNSIDSAWVRHEFGKAIEKEKQHKKLVLFPIRLDNSVFDTTEQWAYDIRKRHIGDFSKWDNPLLYQNSINRLLRDLKADPTIK